MSDFGSDPPPPAAAAPAFAGFRLPLAQAPDGRLVSVAEVERGVADLVCPGCQRPVVARRGAVVRHHFAHLGDTACVTAPEPMLHRFGKQVILEARTLWLPPGRLDPGEFLAIPPAFDGRWLPDGCVFEAETMWEGFRPDVLVRHGDRVMAVEIAVTHSASEEKIGRYRERGVSLLEVDLAPLRCDADALSSVEVLRTAVLEGAQRRWLYHPRIEAKAVAVREDRARRLREAAAEAERQRLAQEEERRASWAAATEDLRRRAEVNARAEAERRTEFEAKNAPFLAEKRARDLLGDVRAADSELFLDAEGDVAWHSWPPLSPELLERIETHRDAVAAALRQPVSEHPALNVSRAIRDLVASFGEGTEGLEALVSAKVLPPRAVKSAMPSCSSPPPAGAWCEACGGKGWWSYEGYRGWWCRHCEPPPAHSSVAIPIVEDVRDGGAPPPRPPLPAPVDADLALVDDGELVEDEN